MGEGVWSAFWEFIRIRGCARWLTGTTVGRGGARATCARSPVETVPPLVLRIRNGAAERRGQSGD